MRMFSRLLRNNILDKRERHVMFSASADRGIAKERNHMKSVEAAQANFYEPRADFCTVIFFVDTSAGVLS